MRAVHRAERCAEGQYGAISSAQLLARDLSRGQINQLVRCGRLRIAHRGVYVVAGSPDTWEQRASVALLSGGDDSALSHRSAGWLHGIVAERPQRLDVTIGHSTKRGVPSGVNVHRAVTIDARKTRGFRVTSPARTLVDLASVLSADALAAALDTALLRGLMTIPVVRRCIREQGLGRKRGVGVLVRLLNDREFGVPASELERRMLKLLRRHRLPMPTRQQRAGNYRADFAFPARNVLVEVDGRAWHGTSKAFDADPVRQNDLVLDGWTIIRFTWAHVTKDPAYVVSTIRQALA